MKTVILAAGYATRLYPLTENKPKCLLEVRGRTILDTLVAKIDKLMDCDEIILVTNSRFYGQLEAWKKTSKARLPIQVIDDGTTSNETRLGAIGDLGLAIKKAKILSDILMLASDNLFDQGLGEFVRFAKTKGVSTALFDIKDPLFAANKYGVFETAPDGRVLSIEEKPVQPRSSLIGMGVYYFPAETLPKVFDYLESKDAKDAPGHYVRWLSERGGVFGFTFQGMWYDIGDLKSLEEANKHV